MNKIIVALLGNPNAGKTTLFNALTGNCQRVGNWSGVTVEKKTGRFDYQDKRVELVDLPGTYSLNGISEQSALDAQIACNYIGSKQADVVVNIVDAANMERNLYLTMQLLEMQVPMILAVNMVDIAKQRGIRLDFQLLAEQLQCPIVPLVSRKKQGLDALKQVIVSHANVAPLLPAYSMLLEDAAAAIMARLPQDKIQGYARWHALRLLENDVYVKKQWTEETLQACVNAQQAKIEQQYGVDAGLVLADARYQQINMLLRTTQCRIAPKKQLNHWLDKLSLNRWLGIPIFLLIMYLMFEFSITIGGILQPLFDGGSRVIFIDGVMHLGQWLGVPRWLTACLAQGIGLGINTVVTFIPQIGGLFLFLCFIEDSGYIARAAFVMDKVMQFIGLPGKSFVPLVIGFGCNVPAIMATRTLESHRDRLLTIMMSPFMSCGARLAIFAVFSTAFFPRIGALMVFTLYLVGIMVALLTGFILKKIFFQGQPSPFVMELPPYHLPSGKTVLIHTWHRLKHFLLRAGKVIVPVCLLIGSLNTIEFNGHVVPDGSEHSILSGVGRMLTPVFKPMGITQDNWPATVGLLTGTLAKEVVVGTLNTLYTQNNRSLRKPEQFNLLQKLRGVWYDTVDSFSALSISHFTNPLTANESDHLMSHTAMGNMFREFGSPFSAFAFMLFVLLYIPCISTMGAISREAGQSWAWLSLLWSVVIAYALAVMVFQIGGIVVHPLRAGLWIITMLLLLFATIFVMQKLAKHSKLFDVLLTKKPEFYKRKGCH